MRTATRSSLLVAALVVVAAVVWSMRAAIPSASTAHSAIEAPALATQTSPGPPLGTDLFRNIARQQNPVVVAIMTKARVEVPFPEDELFQWFFWRPLQPESRVQRGLGSGFLVGRDGEILTNSHVVARSEAIDVGLFGDESGTYRATLIGRDPLSDSGRNKSALEVKVLLRKKPEPIAVGESPSQQVTHTVTHADGIAVEEPERDEDLPWAIHLMRGGQHLVARVGTWKTTA